MLIKHTENSFWTPQYQMATSRVELFDVGMTPQRGLLGWYQWASSVCVARYHSASMRVPTSRDTVCNFPFLEYMACSHLYLLKYKKPRKGIMLSLKNNYRCFWNFVKKKFKWTSKLLTFTIYLIFLWHCVYN